ncbi:MAG: hypothetical protein ACK58L_15285 [Planctomycetota bacterium]
MAVISTSVHGSGIASMKADQYLMNCIQQEAIVFDRAVRLLEQLEIAAEQRTLGTPQHVSDLEKVLQDVVRAQQSVAEARAMFDVSGLKVSPELQIVIRRHEDTLRNLVSRINVMKGLFEDVQSALGYKVDVGTRHRNMQAAYHAALKTS